MDFDYPFANLPSALVEPLPPVFLLLSYFNLSLVLKNSILLRRLKGEAYRYSVMRASICPASNRSKTYLLPRNFRVEAKFSVQQIQTGTYSIRTWWN